MTQIDHQNFTVLMSVYSKENSLWLKESLNSILTNTITPNEIVIVKDGPLNPEVLKVLNDYSINPIFKIVGYDTNRGLGYALNYGLGFCSNELVARMDTDDVCEKNRFEKQLMVFLSNQSLSIVGSNIIEFIDSIDNRVSERIVPETNESILKYAKTRNPFNHPSVMFKKAAVISSGGYMDLYRHEDYYLWYRMLASGCSGFNVQEPLVFMRISKDFYRRRGGLKAFRARNKLNRIMKKDGFIGMGSYFKVGFLNLGNLIIPSFLRKFIHLRFLRKKKYERN